MIKKLKKYYEELIQKPILTSFIVLGLLTILIIGLSLRFYLTDFDNIYMNVLAEAHGMLFDILIIGPTIFKINLSSKLRGVCNSMNSNIFKLYSITYSRP